METQQKNLKARIYRNETSWVVLIRDSVYDGAPRPRYVSQRDFEFLVDAMAHAVRETGRDAEVSMVSM